MENLKVKEKKFGLMVTNIQVNGKIICSMEKVNSIIQFKIQKH
jgi:hypothetical protein